MMKGLWEATKTFLYLLAATWLAFYVVSLPGYHDQMAMLARSLGLDSQKPPEDPKLIITLLTAAIYIFERLAFGLISTIPMLYKLPWVGRYFDRNAMFAGTYLSLPQDPDLISVFKITHDSWSAKYELNGYTYSLSSDPHVVGDWKSGKLAMETAEPVALSYIYEGQRADKKNVRGLVYIKFIGDKPNKSTDGYWLDVDDVGTTDWKRSNYVKVTAETKALIFPKPIFMDREFPYLHIRRLINKPSSIFKAFYARKDALATAKEFVRPRPCNVPVPQPSIP